MKILQYIFLMAVVVFAAACSKSIPDPGQTDSPSLSGSYIFFEPEVMETVDTRTYMVDGTSLPLADRTAFGVLGYLGSDEIFTDYNNGIAEVYRNGEGAEAPFTYTHIAAWTNSTSTHSFYAFYPYSLVNNLGVTGQVPYITYTQPTDMSQMKDILTATLSTRKVSVVPLKFQHRLWALDLIVTNNRTEKDLIYNPSRKEYDEYDPVMKVKSVKFEFDELPKSGTIRLNGETISDQVTQTNKFSFDKTYTYENKVINPGENLTLNGSDSFLFLPCGQFKYRLFVEFENENLGMTYTFRYPSTFVTDAEGNPALDANGQIQWHWATAAGPDTDKSGVGDGFVAGRRYTLDVVRSDYEVQFVWKETDWGEWDEVAEEWKSIEVIHTFI